MTFCRARTSRCQVGRISVSDDIAGPLLLDNIETSTPSARLAPCIYTREPLWPGVIRYFLISLKHTSSWDIHRRAHANIDARSYTKIQKLVHTFIHTLTHAESHAHTRTCTGICALTVASTVAHSNIRIHACACQRTPTCQCENLRIHAHGEMNVYPQPHPRNSVAVYLRTVDIASTRVTVGNVFLYIRWWIIEY